MENNMKAGKNWVGTKNSALTSRFGGLSIQFMILFPPPKIVFIFPKKF